MDDVAAAAEWAGAWWAGSLMRRGTGGFEVHTGRSVPAVHGDLVCFAGRGPGEVFHAGRKVVGLSQWRAREGALFSSCAYRRWDPAPLLELLRLDAAPRAELAVGLKAVATGVGELQPAAVELGDLREDLLDSFAEFGAPAA